jgi:hypothetical protein
MFRSLALAALTAVVFGASAGRSEAAFASGTLGFVPFGTTTYAGADLSVATSITFPALEVVNTVQPTYLGDPNDFFGLVAPLSLVILNPSSPGPLAVSNVNGGPFATALPTITFGPAGRFSYTPFVGEFTSTGVDVNGGSNLTFNSLGTFTDSLGVFDPSIASLSFAATQTGPGSAVNVSFTFATPPGVEAIPEPASAALLGVGVAGLAWVRRRKARTA